MELLTIALIFGVIAYIFATILGWQIKHNDPELHSLLDNPIGLEKWPFWVFHFLLPSRLSALPESQRIYALVAILTFATSCILLIFIVIRFAVSGGSI